MLTEVSKRINTVKDDPLVNYFPNILWVIHDFKGELYDEYGMKMTNDDYLENALKNKEGFSTEVMETNKITTLFKGLFADRHCFPLTESKENPQSGLELGSLKELIFNSFKAKSVNGASMTGRSFLGLIGRILSVINKREVILYFS